MPAVQVNCSFKSGVVDVVLQRCLSVGTVEHDPSLRGQDVQVARTVDRAVLRIAGEARLDYTGVGLVA